MFFLGDQSTWKKNGGYGIKKHTDLDSPPTNHLHISHVPGLAIFLRFGKTSFYKVRICHFSNSNWECTRPFKRPTIRITFFDLNFLRTLTIPPPLYVGLFVFLRSDLSVCLSVGLSVHSFVYFFFLLSQQTQIVLNGLRVFSSRPKEAYQNNGKREKRSEKHAQKRADRRIKVQQWAWK